MALLTSTCTQNDTPQKVGHILHIYSSALTEEDNPCKDKCALSCYPVLIANVVY